MRAFKDGILPGVEFQKARWTGGEITPEIVVLHDTASRLTKGSAANYLRDNSRKVSVHFVIERDGTVVQQVPVDRRANHAGRSNYHGRSGCNGFSIGVEIVNPGRMTSGAGDKARAWYGVLFDLEEYGIEWAETPEQGGGLWMPYAEAQIGALIDLLQSLFDGVDTLKGITTHWYISPGRKVDTNPLFPLEQVRSLTFGREDPVDEQVELASVVVGAGEMVQIDVPGDVLNFRRWPSFNPNVIATIPDGTVVPVLREGEFQGRRWLSVLYGGQEGWIVSGYAAAISFQEAETR
ncbi:MAG: N-acetylmuramoyl-L-alanine amidase [Rhodobacteraceae bacterium]|nr:MAG: N-acetylmuramoyl-L-alanine amidase [Paracoccaceae bacterium]